MAREHRQDRRTDARDGTRPRLERPLVRDGGVLREATWHEALGRAADGIGRTIDEIGPAGVGMFSCSKSTNEMNYAAQKFARTVLGTNNIDSCNRT
jgi:formate dehydrogenase major subunit